MEFPGEDAIIAVFGKGPGRPTTRGQDESDQKNGIDVGERDRKRMGDRIRRGHVVLLKWIGEDWREKLLALRPAGLPYHLSAN